MFIIKSCVFLRRCQLDLSTWTEQLRITNVCINDISLHLYKFTAYNTRGWESMLLACHLPSLSDSLTHVNMMHFHKSFDRTLVSSQNRNERVTSVVKEQTRLQLNNNQTGETFNCNLFFKKAPGHTGEAGLKMEPSFKFLCIPINWAIPSSPCSPVHPGSAVTSEPILPPVWF